MKAEEKDQRSRERALRYRDARLCAKLFHDAMKSLCKARNKAARDRALASLSQAGLWLRMLCGCNPDNLGKAFKTLARAAEGRPLATYDHLLTEAHERERREAFKAMKGLSVEYLTFKLSRKALDKQISKSISGD